jgi:hypothetical protein
VRGDVADLTWMDLGLSKDGPLGAVVEKRRQQEKSDEQAMEILMASLAITAGVVASIATAGGALLVAAAATGVSAGVGLVQLGRDVQKYRAESAAGNVSMDPALADISTREPALLPIVMDVIGLGFDVAGAIGIAGKVAAAERTLAAAGKVAEFAVEVRRLVPNAAVAERIIARARTDKAVMESVEAAVAALGTGARGNASLALSKLVLEIGGETNVFAEFAAKLAREDRICLMSEEAIRTRFTSAKDVAIALRDKATVGATAQGFYSSDLRTLFVAQRDAVGMAATIVHESVHFLQHAKGQNLLNFIAEYQAFMAQRDYLLDVVRIAGSETTVPETLRWLIKSKPNEVARKVSATYRSSYPALAPAYAVPATFAPGTVRQDLAVMVTKALDGVP